MTSTGNDIIALKTVDISRTQHPKFYSKIITPAEKALFDGLQPGLISFVNFVWLLWSVKESVFKYLQRINPELVFSPSRINVRQLYIPPQALATAFEQGELERKGFDGLPVLKGEAAYGPHILYYRSLIYNDLIVSVANEIDDFSEIYWGIKRIEQPDIAAQSKAVREFAIKKLNEILPEDDIQISKSAHGYPLVTKGFTITLIAVSFSHHYYFIAYAFSLK